MEEKMLKELEQKNKKMIRRGVFVIAIVGLVVGCLSGVTAYSFSAKQVSFTPSNKSWKVNNVNDAIESLQLSKTSTNYSTDEQVVGTWIDGKPLYQKTIQNTIPETTADNTIVRKSISLSEEGITDYETIFISDGFFIGSEKQSGSMNYLDKSGEKLTGISTFILGTGEIRISNDKEIYSGRTCYITIQYTKTTDSATNS